MADIPNLEQYYIDMVCRQATQETQWNMFGYAQELSMLRHYVKSLNSKELQIDFVRRNAARVVDAMLGASNPVVAKCIAPPNGLADEYHDTL